MKQLMKCEKIVERQAYKKEDNTTVITGKNVVYFDLLRFY